MKTVHIVNYHYFDERGEFITYGGVQTYITNLRIVLNKMGFQCVVYQCAALDFEQSYNGLLVRGFRINGNCKTRAKKMKRHLLCRVNPQEDLIIFTDELLSSKILGVRTITVEHGIGWDIPEFHKGFIKSLKAFLAKSYHSYERVQFSSNSDLLVCVDYNFMNWYRATMINQNIKYKVIPNFTSIAPIQEKPSDRVNIIFARRLIDYRGTRQICDAIKNILKDYPNDVFFTIAGTGPDYDWMIKELSFVKDRVEFTSYQSDESLKIHADKHIAVVPTVGSEGTSLSLLEAMSAQCAVICTDVGGMTNVIIDKYNGLMVNAGDSLMLYKAIKCLIDKHEFREKIALRGYEIVKNSFSFENWANNWKEAINMVMAR